MDHNLGDSLNLESAMGVDFEHSEDVEVSQADVELEPSSHEEGMVMEFDHIEEQPMLMDTGNEEIIDFMGGQFTLQELSVDSDQMTGSEVTVEASESQNIENTLSSHSDTMIDMPFAHPSITIPAAAGNVLNNFGPRIVSVESATPETIVCRTVAPSNKPARTEVRLAPRQVAIAPKPPRPTITKALPKFVPGKQFAIAPKPKQVSLVKKVSLSTAMQANAKGNTVIAQIGKQFVMLPSGDVNKKIKLVPAGTGVPTMRLLKSADNEQAQLIPNQNASKAKQAKIIIQGQNSSDPSQSSAVITKLLPSGGSAQAGARLVTVPQKVPISINNKMIIQSPIKHGMKLTASTQLVGGKSPVRLLPTPPASQGNTTTTKKIVITSHSGGQNVVLKSTATQKTAQLTKTVTGGQKTQLHPINVPGKGIQYIRLVTNSTTTPTAVVKSSIKPAPPAKTFVITDSKGNVIQMTAEKMLSGQPPPLLITGNADSAKKIPAKPQQRLVRIAPVTSKSQVVMQKDPVRSGQSLLAPISVATSQPSEPSYDDVRQPPPADLIQRAFEKELQVGDVTQQLDQPQESLHDVKAEVLQNEVEEETVENETMEEYRDDTREEDVITQHVDIAEEQEVDSKASLHSLIADAVSSPTAPAGNFAGMPVHSVQPAQAAFPVHSVHSVPARAPPEIHVSFERQHEGEAQAQHLTENPTTPREGDHPLIVIPSFLRNDVPANTDAAQAEPRRLISIEVDPYNAYQSSSPPLPDVTDTDINNELGLRPRKACNCTKSQCLKLYCDCFANGEFCNMCNCNNCHNNLENEELRQKAIRGCLDRNPNAFRPKIGKARSAGPDLVRRHNKGCNCKRSGCLKNYCECYEAKIACSSMCKCVGCRNVEEAVSRARRRSPPRRLPPRQPPPQDKQPCSFMTSEVIEAVCQCLVAAAAEGNNEPAPDPLSDVIHEFARCLQDIIGASNYAAFDEA